MCDIRIGQGGICRVIASVGQQWRDYGWYMSIGVDMGVDIGSYEACCGEGPVEGVIYARLKGWYGSGGGHELAHSRECDHSIASSTARAAGWGLRLWPRGECKWYAGNVWKW